MAIEYEINKRGGGTKKFCASTASTAAETDVNANSIKGGKILFRPPASGLPHKQTSNASND